MWVDKGIQDKDIHIVYFFPAVPNFSIYRSVETGKKAKLALIQIA